MQNVHAMRPEVRSDYQSALGWVAGADDAFAVRFERWFAELRDPLVELYGSDTRWTGAWERLVRAIAATAAGRSRELRMLDHEREVTPDWLQREQAVGYVCYVDRFAGDLAGVRARLPYLRELGVTYLHLMPLLAARPAPNDGGYAVVDYGAVEPSLGTMDDLRALAGDLRAAGMALCIDIVVNHVAAEHPWARRPQFVRTFPDRVQPDAFERTLPEVFPDTAPGSFTWSEEHGRWVWTTFNAYQWDLDYTNPDVFVAMAGAMLGLAAAGVDVLRIDAAPFLWKRLGTDCQNQPEVHLILAAFRAALRIAAPAVALKAEAIVAPRDLVPYLDECDLAYHNVLMVLLWSSLASGRVGLMTATLGAMPRVPAGAGWVTYVRNHDDIGWAITPEDAARVGEDDHLHRRFLADFYAGGFPGSFARGARFQPDARTGEARTCGSCAALAGLASAGDDPLALELAVRRVLLLYALAFAHGGLPLIYMGDELGLLNDPSYLDDAERRDDNRWMHRPFMDWDAAARRSDGSSVEGRLFSGLQRLVATRRATRAIHVQGVSEPVWTGNDHVFGLLRSQAGARLLVLANFTASPQRVGLAVASGFALDEAAAAVDGRPLEVDGDVVVLAPYQHLWLGVR